MKATMISIQKPHTDNIFSGIKKVEWRKYSLPSGKHYVYETKRGGGLGMVIGTFRTNTYYHFSNVDDIPEWLIRDGCVSREFLHKYSGGRGLFANIVYDAKRFEKPKETKRYLKWNYAYGCPMVSEFNCERHSYQCYVTTPPQSFVYIYVLGENRK